MTGVQTCALPICIKDISGIQSQGGEANVRGGSGNYDMLHKATHAALGHLNNAHFSIQAGMDPTHHFEAFDAIHANIKGMDKQLHQSLGAAKHLVSISGGKTTPLLRQTHAVINGRLNDIRDIHELNVKRAMEGRQRKQGQ